MKKLLHALLYSLKEIAALNLVASTASSQMIHDISEIICEEASFQIAKFHDQLSKLKELSLIDLEESSTSSEGQVLFAGSYLSFISSITSLIKAASPTLEPINRWRSFSTLDLSIPSSSTSTCLISPKRENQDWSRL